MRNDWNVKFPQHEELRNKWWKIESPTSFALIFLAIGLVLGGGWYFFASHNDANHSNSVPLIQAEPGPPKIRPQNAGETDVPHQDKLIYNRLNPGENSSNHSINIERLLPPPETPVILNPHPSSQNLESTSSFETEIIMAKDSIAPEQFENDSFPNHNSSHEQNLNSRTSNTRQLPLKKDIHKSDESDILSPLASKERDNFITFESKSLSNSSFNKKKKDGFHVQLGSLPSAERAKKEWIRLKKMYASVLGNQRPNFARVDLGVKKGVYHRLQVGYFKTHNDALIMLNKLNKLGFKGGMIRPN